jgi:uncharacterized low-complexity protein
LPDLNYHLENDMSKDLFHRRTLATALGTAAVGLAMGSTPLFAATDLTQGYEVNPSRALQLAEGKCGEGRCGGSAGKAAAEKTSEGQCGEGRCGSSGGKAEEASKAAEGQCGEGRCGGAAEKATPEKASEGKCGEGRCGGVR